MGHWNGTNRDGHGDTAAHIGVKEGYSVVFHHQRHSFHQLCIKELLALILLRLSYTLQRTGAETRSGLTVTKYLTDDVIQNYFFARGT